jgi:hypothetical protein
MDFTNILSFLKFIIIQGYIFDERSKIFDVSFFNKLFLFLLKENLFVLMIEISEAI